MNATSVPSSLTLQPREAMPGSNTAAEGAALLQNGNARPRAATRRRGMAPESERAAHCQTSVSKSNSHEKLTLPQLRLPKIQRPSVRLRANRPPRRHPPLTAARFSINEVLDNLFTGPAKKMVRDNPKRFLVFWTIDYQTRGSTGAVLSITLII